MSQVALKHWKSAGLATCTWALVWLFLGNGWFHVLCEWEPMTFGDVDLNADGRVTFGEADYACSSIKLARRVDGVTCTEYVAMKDGQVLKVVCPETPDARSTGPELTAVGQR